MLKTKTTSKMVKIYEQWRQRQDHYIVMERLGDCVHGLYPDFGSIKIAEACQVGIEMIKAVRELH